MRFIAEIKILIMVAGRISSQMGFDRNEIEPGDGSELWERPSFMVCQGQTNLNGRRNIKDVADGRLRDLNQHPGIISSCGCLQSLPSSLM